MPDKKSIPLPGVFAEVDRATVEKITGRKVKAVTPNYDTSLTDIEFDKPVGRKEEFRLRIKHASGGSQVNEDLMTAYFDQIEGLRALASGTSVLSQQEVSDAIRTLAQAALRQARLTFGDIDHNGAD